MTVPASLTGAWRRVGLLVAGTRQVDYCDVLWLQTAEWFADIRLRIDPTLPPPARAAAFARDTAFAGVAHWDDPRLTWDHLLDADPKATPDSSPLTWQDGVVAEHLAISVDGHRVPVVEEWLRLAEGSSEDQVTLADRAVRVEVGGWAVDVRDERPDGPFVATRYQGGAGRWRSGGAVVVNSTPAGLSSSRSVGEER